MRSRRGFIGAAVGITGVLSGCTGILESDDSGGSSSTIEVTSYETSVDDRGILNITAIAKNAGSAASSGTVVAEVSGEEIGSQSTSRSVALEEDEEAELQFTFDVNDPDNESTAQHTFDIYVDDS